MLLIVAYLGLGRRLRGVPVPVLASSDHRVVAEGRLLLPLWGDRRGKMVRRGFGLLLLLVWRPQRALGDRGFLEWQLLLLREMKTQ